MLDFRSRRPAPNYFSRTSDRRILLLTVGLALVVLLMYQVRDPAALQWLLYREVAEPTRPVDTRMLPKAEPDRIPDAFVSPAPKAQGANEASGRYFPGVRPSLLRTVRDDTVFRGSEHDCFFHLLQILKQTDPPRLVQVAKPLTFVQLYEQSKEYRGELVTLTGWVRKAVPITPAKNAYGIDSFYQISLQPADDPGSLVVVYCLELPAGFPQGDKLREDAHITGFFFKRWAYKAQDVIRTAPLVLARTIDWTPEPAEDERLPNVTSLSMMVLGAAIFAALVVVYALRRSRSEGQLPEYVRKRLPGAHEEPPEQETIARLSEMLGAASGPSNDEPPAEPLDPAAPTGREPPNNRTDE